MSQVSVVSQRREGLKVPDRDNDKVSTKDGGNGDLFCSTPSFLPTLL